jgi:hemerythrin-like domain-containing protein
MADVFDVLGSDHADVKRMLTELQVSPDASTGATEAVLRARKEVAERLVIDSSAHEAAEEEVFWPAVRERIGNGPALADRAVSQESKAKEILAKIDKLDAADPEFDRLIAAFIPDCREHIEFEEASVWPALREALSPAEANDLGTRIAKAKDRGPTRPHPGTPASPGVLKTVGPAIAVADKLRDAVTGRGKTAS